MTVRIRLLTSDKKGIGRRIKDAARAEGVEVRSLAVIRELRGMSEADLRVDLSSAQVLVQVLEALGHVPGVTVVGSEIETSSA